MSYYKLTPTLAASPSVSSKDSTPAVSPVRAGAGSGNCRVCRGQAPPPRPWRSHTEEISTRALGLVPGGERSGNTGEGERRRKPLCSLFSVHLGRTVHVARGTGGSKLNMGHGV